MCSSQPGWHETFNFPRRKWDVLLGITKVGHKNCSKLKWFTRSSGWGGTTTSFIHTKPPILMMVAMLIARTSCYGKNGHPGIIKAWYISTSTSNIPSPKPTASLTHWNMVGFGNFSCPFKGKLGVFRKASSLFNHFKMIRGVPVLSVRRRVTTPLPGVK